MLSLQETAEAQATTPHEHTQLIEAVVNGDVAAIKKCLASPLVNVNALVPNEYGRTRTAIAALIFESRGTDELKCDVLRLLLSAGGTASSTLVHSDRCSSALLKVLLSASPPIDLNAKNKHATQRFTTRPRRQS